MSALSVGVAAGFGFSLKCNRQERPTDQRDRQVEKRDAVAVDDQAPHRLGLSRPNYRY